MYDYVEYALKIMEYIHICLLVLFPHKAVLNATSRIALFIDL